MDFLKKRLDPYHSFQKKLHFSPILILSHQLIDPTKTSHLSILPEIIQNILINFFLLMLTRSSYPIHLHLMIRRERVQKQLIIALVISLMCLITIGLLLYGIEIVPSAKFMTQQLCPLNTALNQLFMIPMSLRIPTKPNMIKLPIITFPFLLNLFIKLLKPTGSKIQYFRLIFPLIITIIRIINLTLKLRLLINKLT